MSDFWLVRECENKLRKKIIAYRRNNYPIFFYVRGRRQVGKTATVRRLCGQLLPSAHIFLNLMQAPIGSCEPFRALFPDRRLATVGQIAARIQKLIVHEAVVVVIDEFQRCSQEMYGHLKTIVDEIKLHSKAIKCPYGGLIVLGSKTRLMDEINGGLGSAMWHRLEQITLQPFSVLETALVLQHLNITSGYMQLAVSFLTGGYPEFLRCVALYLTSNATDESASSTILNAPWALLPAFSSHHGALNDYFKDELGPDMACLGEIVCGTDPLSPLSDADVISQAAKALKTNNSLAEFALNRLQRDYGVITLEVPMVFEQVCLAAGGSPPKSPPCVYTLNDTRITWYNALHHKRKVSLNPVYSMDVTEADFKTRIHPHLGCYLERCVREIAAYRSRERKVAFPAWRPQGLGTERALLADVLGLEAPIILHGRQFPVPRGSSSQQYGDLDIIALYPDKKVILVASCKLDSSRLEEELHRDAANCDYPTQVESYTRDLRERVRGAWSVSQPGEPDSILDNEAVVQYVDLLLSTETVFHFVYISPDLDATARPVKAFCTRMGTIALARTWFLSIADLYQMDTAPGSLETTCSNFTVVTAVPLASFTPKAVLASIAIAGVIAFVVWRS